jgi:serine/threonine protein phosphatase 1
VHGRADLLEQLLDTIRQDIASLETGAEPPMIVFLGDYVDRGPASRSVVDLILQLRQDRSLEVRTLKGNHEQALLFFLADAQFGRTWMSHGGTTTLMSYNVQPPGPRAENEAFEEARRAFQDALGEAHIAFFKGLELYVLQDDYAFVHAGVRCGIPLHQQDEKDLLWIRQEFLNSDQIMDQVVVHGHSPVEKPYLGLSRIAVDTGAYATGILTAVRVWKSSREILQTR